MLGDDMYRLHRAAADAARSSGDVAGAIVDRADALLGSDRQRLLAAAAAFDAAGSRYQWARTLMFAGEAESTTGATALADLGLAPMSAAPIRRRARSNLP